MTKLIKAENAQEVKVYNVAMKSNDLRVGFVDGAEKVYPMRSRMTFDSVIIIDNTKYSEEIKANSLMEIYCN